MEQSIKALCVAIKRIIISLKPNDNPLSLVLLVGAASSGKSQLMQQSNCQHICVESNFTIDLYYNTQGIIIDLNIPWIKNNKMMSNFCKQINRCHANVRISGLLFCVESPILVENDKPLLEKIYQNHARLLKALSNAIGYYVECSVIITKIDILPGFCDFFQYEHNNDLNMPLGFSLPRNLKTFTEAFNGFIEALSQRVLDKIHPARGSLKRTLIREFPIQFASLGASLQQLVQALSQSRAISNIYFTSAQQGHASIDQLNLKIQQEYALILTHNTTHAINYRAYFIDGALLALQQQTLRYVTGITYHYKIIAITCLLLACSLLWVAQHTLAISYKLNNIQHELIAYKTLSANIKNQEQALSKLTDAVAIVDKIPKTAPYIMHKLKSHLTLAKHKALQNYFLPQLLTSLESTIKNSQNTPQARYHALKVYLMLNDPEHFSSNAILSWLQHNDAAQKHKEHRGLLANLLRMPLHDVALNQQLINNTRNELNALPIDYLYYNLAKAELPQKTSSLIITGFNLAHTIIPVYLTKAGFKDTILHLKKISLNLQAENWVLKRQDARKLTTVLEKAYYREYVKWWQQFMLHSMPMHASNYKEITNVTTALQHDNAIKTLITYLQQQTRADSDSTPFNKYVACNFTELNLVSSSEVRQFSRNVAELTQFMNAFSAVDDDGKTAFQFVKSRFLDNHMMHPLSTLYRHATSLPTPIGLWSKQIADNIWAALLTDTRNYINKQWQQTVFPEYNAAIAHRFPFDNTTKQEITVADFNKFFAPHGILNNFIKEYLAAFIDTTSPQWGLKQVNQYVLPIPPNMLNELIRANVITNMFFPKNTETSTIQFSLQKVTLDPVIARLRLSIGNTELSDTQTTESLTNFSWPTQNAKLLLKSIEGRQYALEETGPWAFFKLLQQVNVLVDDDNAATLNILFEVNGNSGRYILKTENAVNPFIPGILNDFVLTKSVV